MATLRPTKTRLGGVIAAGMTAALVLAGCAGEGGDNTGGGGSEDGTVKIGFMGDLTGENSGIVIPPWNGAQLAVKEYNDTNPDTKIELVKYDSQGKEDQAANLARKAVNEDNITAMIGPAFSGESKAVGPILEEAGVPSISASATNPGLAENGWKYWHRLVANDNDQGPAMVELATNTADVSKAYVVSDDQEYSVGLADAAVAAFKKEGVEVEQAKFERNESNYSATVNDVKAADPDVIVFAGYYAQGGKLLKQLRDGGADQLFITGDGSYDPSLISGAGKAAAEGAVATCPCRPVEVGGEFAKKYKAEFNTDPAIYSTEGYDSATAFVEAVKAGNTDRDSINKFLATIDVEGVSKQIKFTEKGEPEAKDIYIYEVVDGAFEPKGLSSEAKLEG